MFDIGFSELALVCVIALLVLGPERMPQALRTMGLWFGRMRRTFLAMKTEIEREIGMDEIRRQLHNEAVMEEIKRLERDVRGEKESASIDSPAAHSPDAPAAVPQSAAADAANGETNGAASRT
jgi:sec-independent protein translocase protein TatB